MRPESILNPRQFCEASGISEGEVAIEEFPRLLADDFRTGRLHWRLEGRFVSRSELPVFAGRPLVVLQLDGHVTRPCVRCLADVELPVTLARKFVLFEDESTADCVVDDNDGFDVLVVDAALDLGSVIEDEVMLFVDSVQVRHERCPADALATLGLAVDDDQARRTDRPESPFAVLKGRSI